MPLKAVAILHRTVGSCLQRFQLGQGQFGLNVVQCTRNVHDSVGSGHYEALAGHRLTNLRQRLNH